MKCRTLGIRLAQPFAAIDEAAADQFMASVLVRNVTASICDGPDPSWSVLVFYEDDPSGAASPAESIVTAPDDNRVVEVQPADREVIGADARLVDELKAWRAARASAEGLPPYCVAQNRSLEEIATRRPTSAEALGDVRGFGPARVQKYGSEIISLVASADGMR